MLNSLFYLCVQKLQNSVLLLFSYFATYIYSRFIKKLISSLNSFILTSYVKTTISIICSSFPFSIFLNDCHGPLLLITSCDEGVVPVKYFCWQTDRMRQNIISDSNTVDQITVDHGVGESVEQVLTSEERHSLICCSIPQ